MSKEWICADCVKFKTDACPTCACGYVPIVSCRDVLVDFDYAYEKGRADGFDYGVRKVAELLHEYNCIECKECPMYSECDDDCEIVLLRRLKEHTNE